MVNGSMYDGPVCTIEQGRILQALIKFNFTTADKIDCAHINWTGEAHLEDIRSLETQHGFTVSLILAVVMYLGIYGNSVVIYVAMVTYKRIKSNMLLLMNVAVDNLFLLIFCLPWIMFHYVAPTWPFGTFMCKFVKYIVFVLMCVNIYTLLAIGVVRLYVISQPLHAMRRITKKKTYGLLVGIWVMAVIINFPILYLAGLVHYHTEKEANFICIGLDMDEITPFVKIMHLCFFIISYLLPLIIIFIVTCITMKKLQTQECCLSQEENRNKKTATCVLIAVACTYVICLFPINLLWLIQAFVMILSPEMYVTYKIVALCLAFSNSCISPFIYHFCSSQFRKDARKVFGEKRTRRRDSDHTFVTNYSANIL